MQKRDTRVIVGWTFCCLAATFAGCGGSSKTKSNDADAESFVDTGSADLSPRLDVSRDTIVMDASPDATTDLTMPDGSRDVAIDIAAADAPLDSGEVDSPQSDAPKEDGLPGHDAGDDVLRDASD